MTVTEERNALAENVLSKPSLYIGGDRVITAYTGWQEHTDPTTGSVLGSFPVAGQASSTVP